MRIVILDGRTGKPDQKWAAYISGLTAELEKRDHVVKHFILKDLDIHHCIGCFDCWVKTPGVCVFDDDSRKINHEIVHADLLLWASPLVMGFPSYHLKKKLDRSIPLVHPYLVVDKDEAHHLSRYEKYPNIGLLVQPQSEDDAGQLSIIYNILSRTCLNLKSWLSFADTTNTPVEELAAKVENSRNLRFDSQPGFNHKELSVVRPPKRLLVLNGSHRGKSGNTPIMLQKVMDGFTSVDGNSAEMLHLISKGAVDLFRNADSVIIGFPLYTDGMTGVVKEFIEELKDLEGRESNPPVAFLVQSGFPEAAHSRYVEQYLIALAERLHSPYLGTLVRGGCEGVRLMPDRMNRKMFETLHQLGRQLAQDGAFNSATIKSLVGVEKYPRIAIPFLKLVLKAPFMQSYWNSQLKKNQVYEQRFAQPYSQLPE